MNNFKTLDEILKAELLERLAYFGGNKIAVAHSLGVNRNTVYRKIKKFGIDDKKFRPVSYVNQMRAKQ